MIAVDQNIEEEEIRAQAFLDELNDELNARRSNQTLAEWNFNINITKENEAIKDVIATENAEFYKVFAKLFFFIANSYFTLLYTTTSI